VLRRSRPIQYKDQNELHTAITVPVYIFTDMFAHAEWEDFQNDRIVINQDIRVQQVMCDIIVFNGCIFVLLCLDTKPLKRTTLVIAASSLLHSLTALPQNKLSPVT